MSQISFAVKPFKIAETYDYFVNSKVICVHVSGFENNLKNYPQSLFYGCKRNKQATGE